MNEIAIEILAELEMAGPRGRTVEYLCEVTELHRKRVENVLQWLHGRGRATRHGAAWFTAADAPAAADQSENMPARAPRAEDVRRSSYDAFLSKHGKR